MVQGSGLRFQASSVETTGERWWGRLRQRRAFLALVEESAFQLKLSPWLVCVPDIVASGCGIRAHAQNNNFFGNLMEAEAGRRDPAQQLMEFTNYYREKRRIQQMQDKAEEEFWKAWEVGFWEEGIWEDDQSDLSDLSDATIDLTDKAED
ncbi:hypothetical protein N0V93_008768 [Gnomoniopsis smithogilvyi]|uniref:Uncharacterized protein n=1 Tax=Gnomoniopsis smithogilvyi TaxID=1191159 RepID=A0A9W8YNT9_9PEZI|nr:hypothetical protein N0V93_008768 [Gnomoniopsis smithogilvyi]